MDKGPCLDAWRVVKGKGQLSSCKHQASEPMLSSAPVRRQTPPRPQPDPNQTPTRKRTEQRERDKDRSCTYMQAIFRSLALRLLVPNSQQCKRRLLTNLGGLLHVNPLAVILQQELMAPWGILQGNAVYGSGPKHSHSSCCLKGNKGKA